MDVCFRSDACPSQCFKRWAIFEAKGITKSAGPADLRTRKRKQKISADEDIDPTSESADGGDDEEVLKEDATYHQTSSPEPPTTPPKAKRKKSTLKSDNGKTTKKATESSNPPARGPSVADGEHDSVAPSAEQTPMPEAKKKRPRPKPKPRFTKAAAPEEEGEDGPSLEGASTRKADARLRVRMIA